MPAEAVTVLIEYRARSGRSAEALSALAELVATVVAREPDCAGIRVLQDGEEPHRILLDERWSSREAYLGPHFQTPHLQAFIARAGDLFEGPPSIRFWLERGESLPGGD